MERPDYAHYSLSSNFTGRSTGLSIPIAPYCAFQSNHDERASRKMMEAVEWAIALEALRNQAPPKLLRLVLPPDACSTVRATGLDPKNCSSAGFRSCALLSCRPVLARHFEVQEASCESEHSGSLGSVP